MNARPLPYNIEAEEATLGSLMIDNSSMDRVVDYLAPASFYHLKHQAIMTALVSLYRRGEPCDPVTLTDELERTGHLNDAGGPAAVTDLFLHVPTAIHVEHYARIVYRDAMRREAILAGGEVARKAYDSDNVIELRAFLQNAADKVKPIGAGDALDNAALGARLLEQVRHTHATGIAPLLPVGVKVLEEFIHGWERTKVTVFGALSSVGKTSNAVSESVALAEEGFSVAYVSVEIDAVALASRFISHIAALDETQIIRGFLPHDVAPAGRESKYPYRRGDQASVEQDIAAAADTFGRLPITLIARDYDAEPPLEPDFTPAGIIAALRNAHAARPLDFIVIDHLYILDFANGGDAYKASHEYGETLMAFRKFAEYARAHVLMLHQLDPQKALNKAVPDAACFPGSQRIWQNTDNLIALYAPHMHDKNAGSRHNRIYNVIKARRGITGQTPVVRFEGAVSRFESAPAWEPPAVTLADRFNKPVKPDDEIQF